MTRFRCYLLVPTGEMTPFVDGIASPIYRRADTGELYHSGFEDRHPGIAMAGPGAMRVDPNSGLLVRTPAGDWYVDQPSASGGSWSRSGEPPDVTASPSILIPEYSYEGRLVRPSYHGWLRAGWLEEC